MSVKAKRDGTLGDAGKRTGGTTWWGAAIMLRLALALIAAAAVLLRIATFAGIIGGLAGVFVGYVAAERAARSRLRLPPTLVIAMLPLLLGAGASWFIQTWPLGLPPVLALQISDLAGVLGVTLTLAFAVHFASERVSAMRVLEPALVALSVVSTFAHHRHHRIEHPRFLSDWAWSHGIDPVSALTVLGVASGLIAILMLLRAQASRGVAWLLVLAALLLILLPAAPRLPSTPPPAGGEDDKDDDTKNDDNKSGGSSSQSNQRPPHPIAIVVMHDELPEDLDAIYLRQGVLSRLSGDRLVEDTSLDKDIVAKIPMPEHTDPQEPKFHRVVKSSVYLLAEHSALFAPAHPFALRPIPNPDPSRFLATYDAESHWLRFSPARLVGRAAREPDHMTPPKDPRYAELAKRIIRDMDPRFIGDDVMSAYAIKRYLEKSGVYNSKKKTLTGEDPTASFLFGDLKGYCVHFAHAAALLFRAQGIASRVAIGYAVQTRLRGAGSSVLVMENQAHAWPEIFVDGVGWVTFDIHPERSDDPPPQLLDVELESMLGEMARKDTPKPPAPWEVPRFLILYVLAGVLVVAYAIKVWRRAMGGYRGVLDALSDIGEWRQPHETREHHAWRLRHVAPTFTTLTTAQLRYALGRGDRADVVELAHKTHRELAAHKRWYRWLNPIGWWFTR